MGMRFDFRLDCPPPTFLLWYFPIVHMFKNLPAMKGDPGSIPGLGRSPGKGNGCPLQYSCLANSMNRGSWWATVHEVTESDRTKWLTHMWTPKKCWKSIRKNRILEPGRGKKETYYLQMSNKEIHNWPLNGIMNAKRRWNDIFKGLKENKWQSRSLYLVKILLQGKS